MFSWLLLSAGKHLSLNQVLREQLLKISASSIVRLLKKTHLTVGKKRNRSVPGMSGIYRNLWRWSPWHTVANISQVLFVDAATDRYCQRMD